jgi:uracil phosphoribosyltransferase
MDNASTCSKLPHKGSNMLFNLSDHNSIAGEFLFELREKDIQKDRLRFRRNLERIGEILAYEISKTLSYTDEDIESPLEACTVRRLCETPLLTTILRAGLPFAQGFLNYFDRADIGFIGAYRDETGESLEVKMNYVAAPSFEGKAVVIIDPMLATGSSIIKVLEEVVLKAKPRIIHLAAVIAAPEGIKHIRDFCELKSVSLNIWVAGIDRRLNASYYILPGLGDAGDLSFGSK